MLYFAKFYDLLDFEWASRLNKADVWVLIKSVQFEERPLSPDITMRPIH